MIQATPEYLFLILVIQCPLILQLMTLSVIIFTAEVNVIEKDGGIVEHKLAF